MYVCMYVTKNDRLLSPLYRYNAFLASDSLIKQIPRLLGPSLTKVCMYVGMTPAAPYLPTYIHTYMHAYIHQSPPNTHNIHESILPLLTYLPTYLPTGR